MPQKDSKAAIAHLVASSRNSGRETEREVGVPNFGEALIFYDVAMSHVRVSLSGNSEDIGISE